MFKYLGILILWFWGVNFAQEIPPGETCELVVQEGQTMLVGEVPVDTLFHYFPSWDSLYQAYQPDSSVVNQLKQLRERYEIVCFFGTWCSDSREGVPSFLKALHQARNPNLRLRLLALDRKKDDPIHLGPLNRIERVPTFVIFKNGKEIGRMVEVPLVNFEADFLELVHEQNN